MSLRLGFSNRKRVHIYRILSFNPSNYHIRGVNDFKRARDSSREYMEMEIWKQQARAHTV